MNEKLLQYIWQQRLYNARELHLSSGEPLEVIYPGIPNTHQGPDFSEARIRIGTTLWAGQVELHFRSSDWSRHQHGSDPNYSNVILHVVWEEDIQCTAGNLPVLELKNRVPGHLLARLEEWMSRTSFIPCDRQLKDLPDLHWRSWTDRLTLERLEEKSAAIGEMLAENQFHWNETCWWLLARSFGNRVNSESFELIARSLPLRLLSRERNVALRIEALLLGQGGLLEKEFRESYPLMLQKEYRYLQKKYGLKPVEQPLFFLRMRPLNFPTVRLAQLASLLVSAGQPFDLFSSASSLQEMEMHLSVTAGDYWHYHYMPDEPSPFHPKLLGRSMRVNILLNAVIPLLFTYARHRSDQAGMIKALRYWEELPAESDSITKAFAAWGKKPQHAGESQALHFLKKHYCDARKCLACGAGQSLLRGFLRS